MYSFTLLSFLATCVVTRAIPLESPKEDFSKFFVSPRIVGGEDAPEGYALHQAALVFGQEIYPSLMCGGSLVSDKHVLTAAHCIDPFVWWDGQLMKTLHARVGSNIWYTGGFVVRFDGYRNHPLWNPFTIKNDVGVLIMSAPVRSSVKIATIALSHNWVDAGTKSFVTGWGRTSAWGPVPCFLQLLHVTTISHEECVKGVEAASHGISSLTVSSHAEICTFHSVGHGMCNGDSGSALVSKENMKQIGLVSWGFPCAIGAPDVYTRISGVIDFIQPIIGGKNK